jgi:DNA polymerase IV (archaeal DinB-like DNA polymerase)
MAKIRIIGHLDCDAFFAAVEERDKPHLSGRPIVVGSDPQDGKGRGVVATANYAARVYGIRSAMSIGEAWRRAEEGRKRGGPEVAWVFPRGRRYGEVSHRIMELIREDVELMEQTSVDEAYLDLSFTGSFAAAKALCSKLQEKIYREEKITVSIGIGPNKLIAKIASDREKPRGLVVIGDDDQDTCALAAEAFLEPLPIRAIPGIGPRTEEALVKRNIRLIKDLKPFSAEELQEWFGVRGQELYSRIRGVDEHELVFEYEAKSVGEQTTFDKDTRDPNFLLGELKVLCEGVFRAFISQGFNEYGKVVILVRFADFTTVSRGHALQKKGRTQAELEFEAVRLFMPFLDHRENPQGKPLRLLGVRMEKLAKIPQSLF